MQTLADAGYHAVSGDDLVAHVARGKPLPAKAVLLTFDDASEGQFSRALPILRRHNFVATFFVMTVVLDKPG
jgi:peptidoglycan/xylan/chitin deacetylase (PgdA/CDA1 family)